jgi:hypothetical protein
MLTAVWFRLLRRTSLVLFVAVAGIAITLLSALVSLSVSAWIAVVLSVGAAIAALFEFIRRRLALAPAPARARDRQVYPGRRRRR